MSQDNKSNVTQLHTIISGEVQGVGFRHFAVQHALHLNLRGYARNLNDGTVEVVAQGSRTALETLLTHLRRGPSAAIVQEVRTSWSEQPTEHFSGFHTRW